MVSDLLLFDHRVVDQAEVNILNRGKAYGTFNIKTLYISSIVIFEIGSAICGAAKTMDMMIVGRVIAGLGGNGMYTGCLTCAYESCAT